VLHGKSVNIVLVVDQRFDCGLVTILQSPNSPIMPKCTSIFTSPEFPFTLGRYLFLSSLVEELFMSYRWYLKISVSVLCVFCEACVCVLFLCWVFWVGERLSLFVYVVLSLFCGFAVFLFHFCFRSFCVVCIFLFVVFFW